MSHRLEHEWNGGGKGRKLKMTATLESRVQSVDIAESMILQFCGRARAPYGERILEEVSLAVRESVANAVLHGNQCDMSKKVFLQAELTDDGLTISVKDEGAGFDPDSLPDPLLPDNLLHESGRGLFLVKTCMDDVIMRRAETCGMEVTLVKHVSIEHRRRTHK